MNIKKPAVFIILIATIIVAQLSFANAFSLVKETPIELDQEFTLYEGQVGILAGENVRIEATDVTVQPECKPGQVDEFGKPISCITIAIVPSVNLLVTKMYPGDTGTSEDISSGPLAYTKMHLLEGETQEVYGLKITNTFIRKGNSEEIAEPDYAGFIVKKPFAEVVYPELGEDFKLSALQTAVIQKRGSTVLKMTLDGLVATSDGVYSSLTLSSAEGQIGGIKIRQGEKGEFGNYVIYFTDSSVESGTGAFRVIGIERPPEDIYVGLNEKFEIKKFQKAIVKETGMQIYLRDIYLQEIYCITYPCPEGQKTAVIDVVPNYIVPEFGETKISTITGRAVEANVETEVAVAPSYVGGSGVGTTIYLNAGESAEVFGYKINAAGVGENSATISIESNPSRPVPIKAYLDEKFKLQRNQTAAILDKGGNDLMRVTLNEFVFTACAENEYPSGESYPKIKCDTRVIAYVTLGTKQGTEVATELKIREGEEVAFQGYYVRFADYYENVGIFVVRKGISDEVIKVRLDEKFELQNRQTALVVDEDIYIRMNSLSYAKSLPPQNPVANISVWKGKIIAVPEQSKENDKWASNYDLKEGQEIELYGVKIKFIGFGESYSSGIFAVTKQRTDVINVHVDERFKIAVNQAARVLEANMRIDLLGINEIASCPAQNSDETGSSPPCYVKRTAEFSVSNYIYESKAGVKVDAETVSKEIISTSVESEETSTRSSGSGSVAVQETVVLPVPLPPTPFNVYTLGEGESIEVNDFEIKVLSIGSNSAEFIVTEKSTGISFNYVFSNGWNIFSMPGKIESAGNNCNSSELTIFEYIKESNSFRKVTDPSPGKAYWLYNPGKSCEVKATVKNALGIGDLDLLTPKWNFVAIVPEMIGKKINELGDCDIKAVFSYNADSRKWVSFRDKATDKEINRSHLGKGLAVYSNNSCKLGGGTSISPEPPQLPQIN